MVRLFATNRRLRWFLLGGTLVAIGGSVASIALPLFVLNTTHNAFLLGVILMARELPVTILAPFFGRYIDRVGGYHATMVGLLLSAIASATIPLLQGIPILIIGSAFIMGIGWILLFPVVALYLPALVPENDLDMANSIFRTASIVGTMAGAALGGLMITYKLYAPMFYLDALLSLVTIFTVIIIGKLNVQPEEEQKASFLAAFKPVVHALYDNPTLLNMFIIDATLYFSLGAIGVVLPVYTIHFSSLPWLYSAAVIVSNVGELVGGLIAPYINRRIPMAHLATAYGVMALIMALSYLAIGLWVSPISVMIFTLLASIMLGVLYVVYGTYMQKAVPAAIMGRFQTIAAGLSSVFQSTGNVVSGGIATSSSSLGYTVTGGVVMAGSVCVMFLRRSAPSVKVSAQESQLETVEQ